MGHACVCACAHVGAPASPFAPASQPTSIPEHPDDTKLSLAEKTQMKRSPRQGGGRAASGSALASLGAHHRSLSSPVLLLHRHGASEVPRVLSLSLFSCRLPFHRRCHPPWAGSPLSGSGPGPSLSLGRVWATGCPAAALTRPAVQGPPACQSPSQRRTPRHSFLLFFLRKEQIWSVRSLLVSCDSNCLSSPCASAPMPHLCPERARPVLGSACERAVSAARGSSPPPLCLRTESLLNTQHDHHLHLPVPSSQSPSSSSL